MAKRVLAREMQRWFVEFYDETFDILQPKDMKPLVHPEVERDVAEFIIEPTDDLYRAGTGVSRTLEICLLSYYPPPMPTYVRAPDVEQG